MAGGSLTFIKADTGQKTTFDSSPQYSLPKQHGYVPESVRLAERDRTDMQITYDVYAKSAKEEPKDHLVGTLFQKTRKAIWDAQATR